jgi:predicted RNA binding protein YcfA (HicA-like mRNA interferase family)
MSKVPSLPYSKIVSALQRDGWVVIRHRGTSHIQMRKRLGDEVLRLTVPAHKPVKRPTLAGILKQARIDIDRFLELL